MTTVLDDVKANEQAFEQLRPKLEEKHFGQWVVIAKGQLVAVAATREEALRAANGQTTDAVSRLIRKVGDELPRKVTKL